MNIDSCNKSMIWYILSKKDVKIKGDQSIPYAQMLEVMQPI